MNKSAKKWIGAITIAGLLASPLAGLSAELPDKPYLEYKDIVIYKIVKDGHDVFVDKDGEEVDKEKVKELEALVAEETEKAEADKAKADTATSEKDSKKSSAKEAQGAKEDKEKAVDSEQEDKKNQDAKSSPATANKVEATATEPAASAPESSAALAQTLDKPVVATQKEKENTVDDLALVPVPKKNAGSVVQQPMVTTNDAYIAANPLYHVDDSTGYYKGSVMSWKDFSPSSGRLKLKKEAEKMLGWHYSQPQRMTNGYRDCSSFVHTSLMDAGFMPSESWAFTTYTLPNYTEYLEQISWDDIRPGDIILGDGHVAFYWGEDASGAPVTLESCGTFGVVYGYMETNGWNFDYTSVWRVKGIDDNTGEADKVDAIA
ncbi:hypothetical protein [Peptococcus niger]|uniref:NlpC/P60 domain-containing protein n=1 Tax=Peptococcus niger TaxID=2741 RepID=A0A1G6S3W7_PEPNI|nr:hypothetical protein [Peptococcus niger]SDD11549.1 hypothetical protein SAMN04489866_101218 [Peptococcus niger]